MVKRGLNLQQRASPWCLVSDFLYSFYHLPSSIRFPKIPCSSEILAQLWSLVYEQAEEVGSQSYSLGAKDAHPSYLLDLLNGMQAIHAANAEKRI